MVRGAFVQKRLRTTALVGFELLTPDVDKHFTLGLWLCPSSGTASFKEGEGTHCLWNDEDQVQVDLPESAGRAPHLCASGMSSLNRSLLSVYLKQSTSNLMNIDFHFRS